MVRKREKFRKRTETPRLRTSAILAITGVIIVSFVLALFSAGIIQPYLSGSSPGVTTYSAVNTFGSAIPANTMFYNYSQRPTQTAIEYTEHWVYVIGNVSSVENKAGEYRSCVDPSEPYLYGCSYAAQMTGWIVWTWDGPSQAASVPVDTLFVAECYVVGWTIGELYLNSCVVVQS